ncbi:uncharacterized protein KQ657_001834 [Scheffersomyces spartinae]|uniref:Probable guanine deaminase n=1 Tax=Scheffersomyces spartinae TaxID=45513 RepID=A0A9P8AH83_9ASCO|nr:uncharacterized protein KQ657_001834 [Scheffersomyces spartinae]KAG7192433.1 hypothetical protein KQ657_001834 [Scheffersomyces spartinae]
MNNQSDDVAAFIESHSQEYLPRTPPSDNENGCKYLARTSNHQHQCAGTKSVNMTSVGVPSYMDKDVKCTTAIPYTLYYGTFIHTPELGKLEVLNNTLIGVNSEGYIDFIQSDFNEDDDDPIYFFRNTYKNSGSWKHFQFYDLRDTFQFVVPGFVDTHIHASQYPNVGVGLNIQLLDWLTKITFPSENALGENMSMTHQVYSKIIKKTLSCGTTCASYFTTIDQPSTTLFANLLLQYGQRGFVGKVCMDHNPVYPDYEEDIDSCMDGMKTLIDDLERLNPSDEILVKPIVTPRFALSCTDKLLSDLGKLSKERNLNIQTHISENVKEVEQVKQQFPNDKNYALVYDRHQLLTEKTILAHGVYLEQEEIDLIKQRKCSLSHCPASNTFISSGEAPIKKYLYEDDINVSLGTDVSGGFEQSILGVLKQSILVSHHLSMKFEPKDDDKKENVKLSVADGLYMATLGGAKAVGYGQMLGSFAVGKKFDAQLIDLDRGNIDMFSWQHTLPWKDLIAKWVFSGDDRNCIKVWCNGRLVILKN